MDGKGFDDSGLGERYSYASEPAETEDPLPRAPSRRTTTAVDAADDGALRAAVAAR